MKQRAQVSGERVIPLLVGDLLDRLMIHLKRRVADEDVDPAKLVHRLSDHRAAVIGVIELTRRNDGSPPRLANPLRSVICVLVLVEIGDEHVRALARIGNRHRATDPAVAAVITAFLSVNRPVPT